jgi:hypothetical protein
LGKYSNNRPRAIPGHNIPYAIVGSIILAFGWLGLIAVSALAGSDVPLSTVIVNATLVVAAVESLNAYVLPSRLAALRARIVDALTSRERKQKRKEMIAPRSDLMRNNRVAVADVAEGGATDFERLHAQWKGGPKAD